MKYILFSSLTAHEMLDSINYRLGDLYNKSEIE